MRSFFHFLNSISASTLFAGFAACAWFAFQPVIAHAIFNGVPATHDRLCTIQSKQRVKMDCKCILIDEDIALSAGHCIIDGKLPDHFLLHHRDGTLSEHPLSNVIYDNTKDLAVLRLSEPVASAKSFKSLKILRDPPALGLTGNLYGREHRLDKKPAYLEDTRKGSFQVTDPSTHFTSDYRNDQIVLTPSKSDDADSLHTCLGDSGGPFIAEINGQELLVGILSESSIGPYPNLSDLMQFIRDTKATEELSDHDKRACLYKNPVLTSTGYHKDWILNSIDTLRKSAKKQNLKTSPQQDASEAILAK